MNKNLVGEIAVYGVAGGKTAAIVGWKNAAGKYETLAVGYKGEEMILEGLTEALAVGAMALAAKGLEGNVAVHSAGKMAVVNLASPGWFGSLKFEAGPVYVAA